MEDIKDSHCHNGREGCAQLSQRSQGGRQRKMKSLSESDTVVRKSQRTRKLSYKAQSGSLEDQDEVDEKHKVIKVKEEKDKVGNVKDRKGKGKKTPKPGPDKLSQNSVLCTICGLLFSKDKEKGRNDLAETAGLGLSSILTESDRETMCTRCAITVEKQNAPSGPSLQERAAYEEEGKCFAQRIVKMLGNKHASTFYCSFYGARQCGCIQNYISRKTLKERRKIKDEEIFQSLSTAEDSKVTLPDKNADEEERARFFLTLCIESMRKKEQIMAARQKERENGGKYKPNVMPQEFTNFLLNRRHILRSLGLCERGCQRVLRYSNNFLHKKLLISGAKPRLPRTRGKLVANLPKFEDLPSKTCCPNQCVKMALEDVDTLSVWRHEAKLSQKSCWNVISQMVKLDDKGNSKCSKFINMVTGSCLNTVRKVKGILMVSKGKEDWKIHGMKRHLENKEGLAAIIANSHPPAPGTKVCLPSSAENINLNGPIPRLSNSTIPLLLPRTVTTPAFQPIIPSPLILQNTTSRSRSRTSNSHSKNSTGSVQNILISPSSIPPTQEVQSMVTTPVILQHDSNNIKDGSRSVQNVLMSPNTPLAHQISQALVAAPLILQTCNNIGTTNNATLKSPSGMVPTSLILQPTVATPVVIKTSSIKNNRQNVTILPNPTSTCRVLQSVIASPITLQSNTSNISDSNTSSINVMQTSVSSPIVWSSVVNQSPKSRISTPKPGLLSSNSTQGEFDRRKRCIDTTPKTIASDEQWITVSLSTQPKRSFLPSTTSKTITNLVTTVATSTSLNMPISKPQRNSATSLNTNGKDILRPESRTLITKSVAAQDLNEETLTVQLVEEKHRKEVVELIKKQNAEMQRIKQLESEKLPRRQQQLDMKTSQTTAQPHRTPMTTTPEYQSQNSSTSSDQEMAFSLPSQPSSSVLTTTTFVNHVPVRPRQADTAVTVSASTSRLPTDWKPVVISLSESAINLPDPAGQSVVSPFKFSNVLLVDNHSDKHSLLYPSCSLSSSSSPSSSSLQSHLIPEYPMSIYSASSQISTGHTANNSFSSSSSSPSVPKAFTSCTVLENDLPAHLQSSSSSIHMLQNHSKSSFELPSTVSSFTPQTLMNIAPSTNTSFTPQTLMKSSTNTSFTPQTLMRSSTSTNTSFTPQTLMNSATSSNTSFTPQTLMKSSTNTSFTPQTLMNSAPSTNTSFTPQTLMNSAPSTNTSFTPQTLMKSSTNTSFTPQTLMKSSTNTSFTPQTLMNSAPSTNTSFIPQTNSSTSTQLSSDVSLSTFHQPQQILTRGASPFNKSRTQPQIGIVYPNKALSKVCSDNITLRQDPNMRNVTDRSSMVSNFSSSSSSSFQTVDDVSARIFQSRQGNDISLEQNINNSLNENRQPQTAISPQCLQNQRASLDTSLCSFPSQMFLVPQNSELQTFPGEVNLGQIASSSTSPQFVLIPGGQIFVNSQNQIENASFADQLSRSCPGVLTNQQPDPIVSHQSLSSLTTTLVSTNHSIQTQSPYSSNHQGVVVSTNNRNQQSAMSPASNYSSQSTTHFTSTESMVTRTSSLPQIHNPITLFDNANMVSHTPKASPPMQHHSVLSINTQQTNQVIVTKVTTPTSNSNFNSRTTVPEILTNVIPHLKHTNVGNSALNFDKNESDQLQITHYGNLDSHSTLRRSNSNSNDNCNIVPSSLQQPIVSAVIMSSPSESKTMVDINNIDTNQLFTQQVQCPQTGQTKLLLLCKDAHGNLVQVPDIIVQQLISTTSNTDSLTGTPMNTPGTSSNKTTVLNNSNDLNQQHNPVSVVTQSSLSNSQQRLQQHPVLQEDQRQHQMQGIKGSQIPLHPFVSNPGIHQTQTSVSQLGNPGIHQTQTSVSQLGNPGIHQTQTSVSQLGNSGIHQTSISQLGNPVIYQTQTSVSQLGNSGIHQTQTSVSQLGNSGIHQTQTSASQLGNPGIHQTQTSVSQLGNPGIHQTQTSVSQLGNSGIHQTQTSVSQLGNPGIHQTQTSVSQLGNPGIHQTQTSVSQLGNPGIHQTQTSVSQLGNPGIHQTQTSVSQLGNPGIHQTQTSASPLQHTGVSSKPSDQFHATRNEGKMLKTSDNVSSTPLSVTNTQQNNYNSNNSVPHNQTPISVQQQTNLFNSQSVINDRERAQNLVRLLSSGNTEVDSSSQSQLKLRQASSTLNTCTPENRVVEGSVQNRVLGIGQQSTRSASSSNWHRTESIGQQANLVSHVSGSQSVIQQQQPQTLSLSTLPSSSSTLSSPSTELYSNTTDFLLQCLQESLVNDNYRLIDENGQTKLVLSLPQTIDASQLKNKKEPPVNSTPNPSANTQLCNTVISQNLNQQKFVEPPSFAEMGLLHSQIESTSMNDTRLETTSSSALEQNRQLDGSKISVTKTTHGFESQMVLPSTLAMSQEKLDQSISEAMPQQPYYHVIGNSKIGSLVKHLTTAHKGTEGGSLVKHFSSYVKPEQSAIDVNAPLQRNKNAMSILQKEEGNVSVLKEPEMQLRLRDDMTNPSNSSILTPPSTPGNKVSTLNTQLLHKISSLASEIPSAALYTNQNAQTSTAQKGLNFLSSPCVIDITQDEDDVIPVTPSCNDGKGSQQVGGLKIPPGYSSLLCQRLTEGPKPAPPPSYNQTLVQPDKTVRQDAELVSPQKLLIRNNGSVNVSNPHQSQPISIQQNVIAGMDAKKTDIISSAAPLSRAQPHQYILQSLSSVNQSSTSNQSIPVRLRTTSETGLDHWNSTSVTNNWNKSRMPRVKSNSESEKNPSFVRVPKGFNDLQPWSSIHPVSTSSYDVSSSVTFFRDTDSPHNAFGPPNVTLSPSHCGDNHLIKDGNCGSLSNHKLERQMIDIRSQSEATSNKIIGVSNLSVLPNSSQTVHSVHNQPVMNISKANSTLNAVTSSKSPALLFVTDSVGSAENKFNNTSVKVVASDACPDRNIVSNLQQGKSGQSPQIKMSTPKSKTKSKPKTIRDILNSHQQQQVNVSQHSKIEQFESVPIISHATSGGHSSNTSQTFTQPDPHVTPRPTATVSSLQTFDKKQLQKPLSPQTSSSRTNIDHTMLIKQISADPSKLVLIQNPLLLMPAGKEMPGAISNKLPISKAQESTVYVSRETTPPSAVHIRDKSPGITDIPSHHVQNLQKYPSYYEELPLIGQPAVATSYHQSMSRSNNGNGSDVHISGNRNFHNKTEQVIEKMAASLNKNTSPAPEDSRPLKSSVTSKKWGKISTHPPQQGRSPDNLTVTSFDPSPEHSQVNKQNGASFPSNFLFKTPRLTHSVSLSQESNNNNFSSALPPNYRPSSCQVSHNHQLKVKDKPMKQPSIDSDNMSDAQTMECKNDDNLPRKRNKSKKTKKKRPNILQAEKVFSDIEVMQSKPDIWETEPALDETNQSFHDGQNGAANPKGLINKIIEHIYRPPPFHAATIATTAAVAGESSQNSILQTVWRECHGAGSQHDMESIPPPPPYPHDKYQDFNAWRNVPPMKRRKTLDSNNGDNVPVYLISHEDAQHAFEENTLKKIRSHIEREKRNDGKPLNSADLKKRVQFSDSVTTESLQNTLDPGSAKLDASPLPCESFPADSRKEVGFLKSRASVQDYQNGDYLPSKYPRLSDQEVEYPPRPVRETVSTTNSVNLSRSSFVEHSDWQNASSYDQTRPSASIQYYPEALPYTKMHNPSKHHSGSSETKVTETQGVTISGLFYNDRLDAEGHGTWSGDTASSEEKSTKLRKDKEESEYSLASNKCNLQKPAPINRMQSEKLTNESCYSYKYSMDERPVERYGESVNHQEELRYHGEVVASESERKSSFKIICPHGYNKLSEQSYLHCGKEDKNIHSHIYSPRSNKAALKPSVIPMGPDDTRHIQPPHSKFHNTIRVINAEDSNVWSQSNSPILRQRTLESDFSLAQQMIQQQRSRHPSLDEISSPCPGSSKFSSPSDFDPLLEPSLLQLFAENELLKHQVLKGEYRHRKLSELDRMKAGDSNEGESYCKLSSIPSSPSPSFTYSPSRDASRHPLDINRQPAQESRSRNPSGSHSIIDSIVKMYLSDSTASPVDPNFINPILITPLYSYEDGQDPLFRAVANSIPQRVGQNIDSDYDSPARHRNLSSSSHKELDFTNRSRNPSSSSLFRSLELTTMRSRNPSGSSNRRSRPGSSSSERDFLANLVNMYPDPEEEVINIFDSTMDTRLPDNSGRPENENSDNCLAGSLPTGP